MIHTAGSSRVLEWPVEANHEKPGLPRGEYAVNAMLCSLAHLSISSWGKLGWISIYEVALN